MKLSYSHPKTNKRTSITINDRIFRLWAITHDIDIPIDADGVLYKNNVIAMFKGCIFEAHEAYLKRSNNFPTFVSYFENTVFIDIENLLLEKRYAI